MGRIKSLMIKRAAKQLTDSEHVFTDKFDHNKKVLRSNMPSKKVRNKIAGYIARLERMKKEIKSKKKPVETPKEETEQI